MAEKTDTLTEEFYPTTDLVTGAGHYFLLGGADDHGGVTKFMGDMLTRNVDATGIIRDKQTRKISKSPAIGPDPRFDLILVWRGCVALWRDSIRRALGQDVLYDEQQVELGPQLLQQAVGMPAGFGGI